MDTAVKAVLDVFYTVPEYHSIHGIHNFHTARFRAKAKNRVADRTIYGTVLRGILDVLPKGTVHGKDGNEISRW